MSLPRSNLFSSRMISALINCVCLNSIAFTTNSQNKLQWHFIWTNCYLNSTTCHSDNWELNELNCILQKFTEKAALFITRKFDTRWLFYSLHILLIPHELDTSENSLQSHFLWLDNLSVIDRSGFKSTFEMLFRSICIYESI